MTLATGRNGMWCGEIRNVDEEQVPRETLMSKIWGIHELPKEKDAVVKWYVIHGAQGTSPIEDPDLESEVFCCGPATFLLKPGSTEPLICLRGRKKRKETGEIKERNLISETITQE